MLDWLKRMVGGSQPPPRWPTDVPRLFPMSPDAELAQLPRPAVAGRPRAWTVVMACPLFEPRAQRSQIADGAAFSRLLLRNLMLTPGLSVRGPEDTPVGHLRVARMLARSPRQADVILTGRVLLERRPRATLVLLWRGRAEQVLPIRAASPRALLLEASEQLAVALGGVPSATTLARWQGGLPPSLEHLRACGRLLIAPRPEPEEALALWRQQPDFTLPLHLADQGDPHSRTLLQALMEGAVRDEHDAHLHYLVFCRLWRGRGPQPEALQFLRRALSVAPGHGRALLCAAHAVPDAADSAAFSELGYRLLPGDPAALSSYILAQRSPEQRVVLAQQSITTSPWAPSGYDRAIEALVEIGRLREALDVARRLQALYEPQIHERARRRLRLDPLTGPRLLRGWDPGAENRRRIQDLESRLR